jgi:hypothetical protein
MTARTRIGAAVVLAGLALGGCTGADPPPPPATTAASRPAAPALLQQVVARTMAAKSSRFTTTSRLAAASPRDAAVWHGAFDYAGQRGWWDAQPHRTGTPGSVRRTLRIGRAVYHATLADRPARPGAPATVSGRWLKVELPAGRGELLGNSGEPTMALELLRDAARDVTTSGRAELRGAATTRYAVVLDMDRYATTLGSDGRDMLRGFQVAGTLPAEVWVDAQGRLRRLHLRLGMTFKEPAGGTTPRSVTDFTTELYDFGVPVQVTPPPADQVCSGPDC